MPGTGVGPEDASLPARAVLWKAAGRAWAYPNGELLATFAEGLFEQVVTSAWARVAGSGDDAAERLGRALRASLAAEVGLAEEHTFLFSRELRCPPYESSYFPGPHRRTQNLSQLGSVLKALGLRLAPETRDLPDHIGILMELVGHTQAREALLLGRDDTGGALTWRQVRRRILADHLGEWVEQFCARLKTVARLPFYPALADFTLRLRQLEREALSE